MYNIDKERGTYEQKAEVQTEHEVIKRQQGEEKFRQLTTILLVSYTLVKHRHSNTSDPAFISSAVLAAPSCPLQIIYLSLIFFYMYF